MSFTSKIYTLAGGGSGISFVDDYVAIYSKTSGHMAPQKSYFDYGDDKLYICGHDGSNGWFMELSNQGEILRQKTETNIYTYRAIHVDSSNDIYLCGSTNSSLNFQMVKYNSSMVHQWSREYQVQNSSTQRLQGQFLFNAFNHSDYLGGAGYAYDQNNRKYAAMIGSIKKSDGDVGNGQDFTILSEDNTNQYVTVQPFSQSNEEAVIAGLTSRITGAYIAKHSWNNSQKRWYNRGSSKGLQGSSNSTYPMSMAKDSADAYLFGYHQESGYKVGTVDAYLVRFYTNSAITPTYEKGYGVTGFSFYPYVCDSDGTYVYTVGSNGNTNYLVAIKQSDGTIYWQNKITGLGNFQLGLHVDYNASKLIITGTTGGHPNGKTVVMRVPKNGSGTGTYGSVTYASTSDVQNYNMNLTNTSEENYDSQANFGYSGGSFSNSTSDFTGKIDSYN
jgi:hypothetical protein